MNKYTLKYILSIIGVALFAVMAVTIAVLLEELDEPWVVAVIYTSSLAGMIHIVASIIYDKNEDEDPKGDFHIPKIAIGIVFMISTLSQIICMTISVIEAYKRFGSIHFLEYFIAAIFMLASAYAYKRASYKLIKKEKKNE